MSTNSTGRELRVTLNVRTGAMRIHDPRSEDWDLTADGDAAAIDLEPWGPDEEDFDRADAALKPEWERITEWTTENDEEFHAWVRRV